MVTDSAGVLRRFARRGAALTAGICMVLTAVVLATSGCGQSSGKLLILSPVLEDAGGQCVRPELDESGERVPKALEVTFRRRLAATLGDRACLDRESGLVASYRFIQSERQGFGEGMGGIGSGGFLNTYQPNCVSVQVDLRLPDGTPAGTIRAECQGREAEDAADRAAYLIASYVMERTQ